MYVHMVVWLLADGGEAENEEKQDIAYKNWFAKSNGGEVQHVSWHDFAP